MSLIPLNPVMYTLNPSRVAFPGTGVVPTSATAVVADMINTINQKAQVVKPSVNFSTWVPQDLTGSGSVTPSPQQVIGETVTWTYVLNSTSGSDEAQITGKVLYSNASDRLNTATDGPSGIISGATSNYFFFEVVTDSSGTVMAIEQTNQYDIVFAASNFTAVNVDSAGYNVTGDSAGGPLWNFDYSYVYVPYTVSFSVDSTGTPIASLVPGTPVHLTSTTDLKNTRVNAISFIPFESYIMSANGNLLNFDLFYNWNNLNNIPLIQAISGGQTYYLAYTLDAITHQPTLTNIPVVITDSTGKVYDQNGNLLTNTIDSAGNYISGSFNAFAGPYITTIGGSVLVNYTTTAADGQAGNVIQVPTSIVVYEFADFTIDSTGKVQFKGPVIVELVNMLEEVDDTTVDECCNQINNMITSINQNKYNFGTFSNYQELIKDVNDYTTSLDQAKISLNIEQVTYLEQYAANVSQMSNLFGQLVIQLNSASLVDSESICQRIRIALGTIAEGLQNLKAFKIAIGQQNLLKISECLLHMSGKLTALLNGLASTTVTVGANSYKIGNDGATAGALFLLNESIWYFASGLPATTITYNGSTYYQTYTDPSLYVLQSFYSSNFDLAAADLADIAAADKLIKNLNQNINNNVQMVNSNPDVIALGSALGQFQGMSTNLTQAQNNLMYKLGQLGIKIQLKF